MKAATHAAFAGVVGVTAAGFGAHPGTVGAGALLLGALLPDVDTAHSGLGRWVRPVSTRLERKFGHRTLTHSLLGTLVVACVFSWLLLLNPAALVWLLIGYLSHLLLDTANVSGVPLLWPWRLQFWLVGNRAWRVPYGSPQEFVWFGVFCAVGAALTPLSIDGASTRGFTGSSRRLTGRCRTICGGPTRMRSLRWSTGRTCLRGRA